MLGHSVLHVQTDLRVFPHILQIGGDVVPKEIPSLCIVHSHGKVSRQDAVKQVQVKLNPKPCNYPNEIKQNLNKCPMKCKHNGMLKSYVT
jgi:hypothetical protein